MQNQPQTTTQPNEWQSQQHKGPQNRQEEQFARALGWFSIGLGLAEVVAPRTVARLIGVADHGVLLPLLGLREMASGMGILTQRRPVGWVQSRVGGDVMDLALLGTALISPQNKKGKVMAATAAVAGVTFLDLLCSERLSRRPGMAKLSEPQEQAIRVEKSVTVNRSPEELYRFWRNLENLPRFMHHLESVQATSATRSHWVAKAPAGTTVEWDAEIINDEPGKVIAWRSLEGADVDSAGSVRFVPAPAGRGTEIKVTMHYHPPGGIAGATVAKLFGQEPGQQIREDLRRFKRLMEAGEIPTTDGQPSGRNVQAGH